MKSVPLNLRIPQKMMNQIISDAEEQKTSLSDLLRNILNLYFNDKEDPKNKEKPSFSKNLFKTYEFLLLLTWMMEKRRFADDSNDVKTLEFLKSVCLKIIKDESIDDYLREEFEKVFIDLTRFIQNYGSEGNRFTFCEFMHNDAFDYTCLIDYIKYMALHNKN